MQHRGQVSLALILGIMIVIIAVLLFASRIPSIRHGAASSDPAFAFITACLEQSGTEAIQHVALTGGYARQDIPPSNQHIIPVPPLSTIEQAISQETKEELTACYQEFAALRQQGIRVSAGPARVTTIITREEVQFTLDQTITLEQEGVAKLANIFSARVSAPLLDIITEARKLQIQHPEGIDITSLIRKNVNATIFVEQP